MGDRRGLVPRDRAAVAFAAVMLTLAAFLASCDVGPSQSSPAPNVTELPSLPATPSSSSASSATPSAGASASTSSSSPGASADGSPSPVSYVVVRGDTLTSIARHFATTARSIAFWNRDRYPSLDPTSDAYAPNRIEAGWVLTVVPGTVVDEQDLPTPTITPIASVSIAPSATPSGTASALVSNGSRDSNAVALTFDMGGRLDPALGIVDWLVAHGVHATVFSTGASGSGTDIGQTVLGRLAAHPDLFSVGNHSWDHPDFTKLSAAAIADQLDRTEAAIAPLVGRSTQPFFRPPYGAVSTAVRTAVGAAGWRYTVMWDVDTIDWKPESDGGPSTDDIVAKVIARAKGGSIVLMHLGGYHTLDALPRIVDGLRARGLEPVTLERLLGVVQAPVP